MAEKRRKTAEIIPPPNGTMEYVRGLLSGIAEDTSRPRCWVEYYGQQEQQFQHLQKIADLLRDLNAAGVGSGRTVTIKFTDSRI